MGSTLTELVLSNWSSGGSCLLLLKKEQYIKTRSGGIRTIVELSFNFVFELFFRITNAVLWPHKLTRQSPSRTGERPNYKKNLFDNMHKNIGQRENYFWYETLFLQSDKVQKYNFYLRFKNIVLLSFD